MECVLFIGLGIMGRGMAANLLKAGFDVTVWNRTIVRMEPLAAKAHTPGPILPMRRCAVTSLLSASAIRPMCRQWCWASKACCAAHGPARTFIDCSTISPKATKEIATRLAQNGVDTLDAPVSGGSEGAAKGKLSIMVGGAAEQFERAQPVFQAMGKTVTHVGGAAVARR